MTGWSGGIANRTWQRDNRSPTSGRIRLIPDIRRILTDFRTAHGYLPGMEWDPYTATYEWPSHGRSSGDDARNVTRPSASTQLSPAAAAFSRPIRDVLLPPG